MLTPLPPHSSSDEVLSNFLEFLDERGVTLYAEQEEAILELYAGSNVILNTPTGSGKSLVATAFHFLAFCKNNQSVYTCPIKALVNEKFMAMCKDFGAQNVGMMTGDASVNPDAPILCCTAEILANIALIGGERAQRIRAVIMDEFHYYSDPSRGVAWQIPLLLMPWSRFLLMSATLGATEKIQSELEKLTSAPVKLISSSTRPVPLEFIYNETPLVELLQEITLTKKTPVYLVYFTQKEASEAAQSLASLALSSRDEREKLATAIAGHKFNSPYGLSLKRWLSQGIGVHHAGLLPRYRILVEQLAQQGLLKIICGTDTLGVGINVPIRTVIFTQLFKYNGTKSRILSVRDFRQISGRAGRKGYDDVGYVYIQAPEHVIANKRAEEKLANSGKKGKKPQKQKPAEGEIVWDKQTFEKLLTSPSEPLQSRFQVNHGMLLNVLRRDEDGCKVMQELIRRCHETESKKIQIRQFAWKIFRSLLDRKILSFIPQTETGRKLAVNVDLQEDFSLNHALSLYLIDALPQLPGHPNTSENTTPQQAAEYALNVLSLCESIQENPEMILRQQLSKAKSQALANMKEDDLSYEERMERLLEVEYPKPLKAFLENALLAFASRHPWIGSANVQPKSIAREMYERYISFSAYIKEYHMERQEGVLLRYLSQTLKVLVQNVPATFKTPEIIELETYLRELVKGIDSSLLEEWQHMMDPNFVPTDSGENLPNRPMNFDIMRDKESFNRLLRHEIFLLMNEFETEHWNDAAQHLGNSSAEFSRRLENDLLDYFAIHDHFRLDPQGRTAGNTTRFSQLPLEISQNLTDDDPRELICQRLIDWDDENDFELRLLLNITKTKTENRPILEYVGIFEVG